MLLKRLAPAAKPFTTVWFCLISAAMSLASVTQMCMIRGYGSGKASALAPLRIRHACR
jgi:hypothetical protein